MKKPQYISAIISFILFMSIAHFVFYKMNIPFDPYLLEVMGNWEMIKMFSVLGTELVIGFSSIALILFLWWKKKDYVGVLTVVVAVAGSNVLNKVIKGLMERERPTFAHGEEGYSFPSGHAMVGIVFLFIIAYYISKEFTSIKIKVTLYICGFLLAFVTGISRIAENAHYPSDVAAGFFLGYSYFVLCITLYEKRPQEER
ncbi:phosphatase PAP2 family protein [Rossellomorea aquimaris]|uniref:phosphatase PAP2 family protein n=1 Tax=Rossellomorea aquimaris TaxID=189382 RepID=UPI0007D0B4B7|nr:phosphatase PAP2 family protein [Rossellomorea aquimaris]